ncbi:MAG: ABC transporter ATP-binding protein [candidate division WOR-3 bacterium]
MKIKEYISHYVNFLKLCKEFYKYGYWSAVLTLVAIILQLPGPFLTKYAIDRVFPQKNMPLLNIIALGLLLLMVFKILSGFLNEILLFLFRTRAIMKIQLRLFAHIEDLSVAFHNEKTVGFFTTRLGQDTANLQGLIADTIINFARSILTFIFGICALFFIHWKLATISLLFLPFFAYFTYFFSGKIRDKTIQLQEAWRQLYDVFFETLYSIPVIKAFCLEDIQVKKADQKLTNLFQMNYDLTKTSVTSGSISAFIGGLGPLVILWYGGMEIMANRLTLGSYFAFTAFLGYLYNPVQTLISINAIVQRGIISLPRVFEIFHESTEYDWVKENISLNGLRIKNIVYRSVSFSYNGTKPIIKNINFQINARENIAIIGKSGSGKTTLINLLLKFYKPTDGVILINGINIENIKTKDLRQKIGIVLQSPYIFSGTIADNIRIGNINASEEEMIRAAKLANIYDFILSLPKGFETEVGERGVRLSGGERQRLAIARVVLKKPEIIILDEATSELDVNTEKSIFDALYEAFGDKIIIMITHRLYNILNVDKIIYLEDGEVAGIGDHKTLYNINPSYKNLFDKQSI